MFDALKALQTEKEAIDKKMREAGEKAVREALKEFFAANPQVRRIKWDQYTPYFNDGDPCTFSVNDARIDIGSGEDAGEYEDGFLSEYDMEDGDPLKSLLREFNSALSGMEDAMLAAFGDHAEIIATPEEITVQEYEHD